MTRKLHVAIMTLFCLTIVGAGAAQEEDGKALKRNIRNMLQAGSTLLTTAGTLRLINRFQQWDKFFLTPQFGMVPANLVQYIDQADREKNMERCVNILLLGLCGNMYTALPTLTKQDDIFLPIALTMHGIYGVFISAANLRMIYDIINRHYMSPQRSLIDEQCTSCSQVSRETDLLVPCGDSRHCICVECYSDSIEWAEHYQCSFCTKVIPAQEIMLWPRSLYDKISRFSVSERSSIRILFFWQCIVFVTLYLSLQRAVDA